MFRESMQSLYERDFSKHDYDRYYFGLRYIGNRYLVSKLFDLGSNGKRILDLGSGRLILSSILSRNGSSVVAYDLPEVLNDEYVRKRAKSCGVRLIGSKIKGGNKFRLPFKNNSFDIVIMTEVFEHLNFSPRFLVKEIHRVLKEKSYFILTTPNVHRLENKIKFLLNKNIYGNCDRYLKTESFEYHWREFEKKELFEILIQHNFKVVNSFFCNDILYNKYNAYLYNNFSKKIKACLIKIMYLLSYPVRNFRKQIIIFAAKK